MKPGPSFLGPGFFESRARFGMEIGKGMFHGWIRPRQEGRKRIPAKALAPRFANTPQQPGISHNTQQGQDS
jgi:hypothetical protein